MLYPQAYPEVVKTFLEIIPIANPSTEEEELTLWLVDKLTSLGINYIEQDNFGNLIAKVKSNIEGNTSSIMFICHLDSVYPCQNIEYEIEETSSDYIIKSRGKTILSADDKAGIAALIAAIEKIKESGTKHPTIELVFTVQEEIGLLGAKALDYSKFESEFAYSIDGEAPVGTIFTQGPGQKIFKINFTGKCAHAGMNPEKGISSIKVAADFLSSITVGRIDTSTTSNIGKIQGGLANNIVPEHTSLIGEARSLYEDKLSGIIATYKVAAQKAVENVPGSGFEFLEEFRYHNFFLDAGHPAVLLAIKACKGLKIPHYINPTGSGSDANIFNFNNIPTVILGAGFQNTHSFDEIMPFSQLQMLKKLLIKIITESANQ